MPISEAISISGSGMRVRRRLDSRSIIGVEQARVNMAKVAATARTASCVA